MEPQSPPPKDGPSLPPRGCCADGAGWSMRRRLVSAQEGGLGWRAEGPALWGPDGHHRILHRPPATPHPAPGGLPEAAWPPTVWPPWPPGPRRSRGTRGRRAPWPGHGHSWWPRGCSTGREAWSGGSGVGGWMGGGPGRARERGREANKRSLCGAAGRRGAHYPMPRSHVGNKRTILCLAWKTTWSRERPGES